MSGTTSDIFGWTDFQDLYDQMVDKYDDTFFFEVGCFKGKSVIHLANRIKEKKKNIKVIAVDIWPSPQEIELYNEHGAGQSTEGVIINKEGQSLMQEFIDNLNRYNVRDIVFPVRAFSWNAATIFPDKYFSFGFIDAGHSYDQVTKDLQSWYPKIKDDGIIAGHDYDGGVYKAVNDFFKPEKEVERICIGSWIWRNK